MVKPTNRSISRPVCNKVLKHKREAGYPMKKHMKLCLCMMMIFVLTLAGSMDGLGAEEKAGSKSKSISC
ncbi:hypothetical protein PO124_33960 [Bacillus licheniformis]|nr:hypothetical protein [Bacillus licheniformis]